MNALRAVFASWGAMPPGSPDSGKTTLLSGYQIAGERIAVAADPRVTSLILSGLGLTRLPPALWEMDHLEDLDLSGNRLAVIPREMLRLRNLRRLDLRGNPVTLAECDLRALPGLGNCLLDASEAIERRAAAIHTGVRFHEGPSGIRTGDGVMWVDRRLAED
ncbi:leucine-rich repeat domain-containing protein [Noviherbaspirillum galbum]|uniref:Leucine-rich repeat domain-containing protein n=1 Tax=Noviherbaspirillum galbum TaxID=2709383 RepID=A0A6B3SMW0_9BURK|nr:leucine-rich repeat domain-containing protein [Noviherbaspirillum galbum]NEX59722.1 leucine-rich repeat domain-containing protein [Noviherbaspirillum galbum]